MLDKKSAIYGFIIEDCLRVSFELKKGSFHCKRIRKDMVHIIRLLELRPTTSP